MVVMEFWILLMFNLTSESLKASSAITLVTRLSNYYVFFTNESSNVLFKFLIHEIAINLYMFSLIILYQIFLLVW
jgi:hypothetical protein